MLISEQQYLGSDFVSGPKETPEKGLSFCVSEFREAKNSDKILFLSNRKVWGKTFIEHFIRLFDS